MSKKNFRKEYENCTLERLKIEKMEIEHIVSSCQEYLKSAYNTFLGPLSAAQTIKQNCKKLEIINSLIREKESQKIQDVKGKSE